MSASPQPWQSWDAGTWKGLLDAQLRDDRGMSLADKLAWLEESAELAERLARQRGAAPRRRPS
jgi:hypothetical protein